MSTDSWERKLTEPMSALYHRPAGSIPSLLFKRQELGGRAAQYRHSRVTPATLSASIAWNPSRMNNMMLAVGPGTPATAIAMNDESSTSSVSSPDEGGANEVENDMALQEGVEDDSNIEEEEKHADADEVISEKRSRWVLRESGGDHQRRRNRSPDSSDGDNNPIRDDYVGRPLSRWTASDDEDSGYDSFERLVIQRAQQECVQNEQLLQAPSMRHGGCINTAAWLTCPWRLSLTGDSLSSNGECFARPVGTEDCPTQLVTSGDDRVVKFWDVRYAMGTSNPLPGGIDTICPFSAPTIPSRIAALPEWKEYYEKSSNRCPLAGTVIPLATLATGHRGNVFHVTPLSAQPGKVATCAADGYLRVSDLENPTASSIIISPEFDSGQDGLPAGLLSLRPSMCFSFHFLNDSTGLLCSERGLRRFDLRLNPRDQRSRSILGGPYRTCKSCAIWAASTTSSDEVDSAYVFAGGSSGDVALYDLRMADGTGSKVVQHYRPRSLGPDASVSVSGLDISSDKRELLVSYENDQIYTFPIFAGAASASGPTVDELNGCCRASDSEEDDSFVLRELASYGGHLNRFTFLKNAKYAGPRDEYICTGSDSGNAWIYERSTGAVVSLLNTDHSTCNGIIPHPSLPLFLTYGIDSTAKLWRASNPVDRDVDDSPVGRSMCNNLLNYEKTPVVANWKNVQTTLASVSEIESVDETFPVLPDEVPSRDEELERSIFESLGSLFFRRQRTGPHEPGGAYIGNNLRRLPDVLRQNLFACIRAEESGEDQPVTSGIIELKRRISLIRLRHQADQQGLLWNRLVPWDIQPRPQYANNIFPKAPRLKQVKESDSSDDPIMYGHPAELVPNKPSDWLPYDPDMATPPRPCGVAFNTKDYENFYLERYKSFDTRSMNFQRKAVCPHITEKEEPESSDPGGDLPSTSIAPNGVEENPTMKVELDPSSSSEDVERTAISKYSWKVLYETATLLKKSGNQAMRAGHLPVAARRYDKAITYCSLAFISFPYDNIEFLKPHGARVMGSVLWAPLLKLLITTRLNLAMAMLNPQICDCSGACEQARQALVEIKPFATEKGKVLMGPKLEQVRPGEEPHETYREAKELQAKSYFRLGSAQHANKEFSSAVKSFELSVQSTKESGEGAEPDRLVLRRLAEAKQDNTKKKKRRRKKFKLMLSEDDKEGEENVAGEVEKGMEGA